MHRRKFIERGIAASATSLVWPGCASLPVPASAAGASLPRQPELVALEHLDALDGGADPRPIPWLDKNGSHNQSPEASAEPSNIYHFRGRVARANAFTGMGTDNHGRRILFGARSTDFSFMRGEYFAGRQARQGTFGHI